MKAICFEKTGNPLEVLSLRDVNIPEPGTNEIRVKVLGGTINPADILFIQGSYRYKPEFPQIAGLEGAGIVDATGSNVKLKKGSLVAYTVRGVWADYAIIPENDAFVLPDNFPVEKAVQFCLNPFTAWGLLDESKARAGDWILLTAGNSAVSKIVTQLAKLRSIRTILSVRDLKQAPELKSLGADAVLDLDDETSIAKVNELTGGKGITAALEAVGGKVGTNVLQCMAPFGVVLVYGLLRSDPVQFFNSQILFKNITIKGFGMRGYVASMSPEKKQEMVQTLIREMAGPSFQLPVAHSYSFDQFREALRENEKENRNGKVLLLT
ncbi:MAG TPA: zinc-dependent alcohol dehydrogenase family protein [Bacteroidales bacterium]